MPAVSPISAYFVFSQTILIIYWATKNKRIVRDIRTTIKKGLPYVVFLNAWFIIFWAQIVFGPIKQYIVPHSQAVTATGVILYTAGLLLSLWGRWSCANSWGLPQEHDIQNQSQLKTRGAYRHSRNPIYTSELMMLTGFEIALQSWLVILVIPFFYFEILKIKKEEQLLERHFGNVYLTYKKQTPRFL